METYCAHCVRSIIVLCHFYIESFLLVWVNSYAVEPTFRKFGDREQS